MYLCSENKGADQLQGNCAADMRLCFCIYMQKSRFSHEVANMILINDLSPLFLAIDTIVTNVISFWCLFEVSWQDNFCFNRELQKLSFDYHHV